MLGIETKIKAGQVQHINNLVSEYWRLIHRTREFQNVGGRIRGEVRERCLDLEDRIVAGEYRLHNTTVTLKDQVEYIASRLPSKAATRMMLACAEVATRLGIA